MNGKIGICTKCQKNGNVVMHHEYGYEGDNKDNVKPYCRSCHTKIHLEARMSGRCNISVKELDRLSRNSFIRRNCTIISFSENMMPNVRLLEQIHVFPNMIMCNTYFQAYNGMKLLEINI